MNNGQIISGEYIFETLTPEELSEMKEKEKNLMNNSQYEKRSNLTDQFNPIYSSDGDLKASLAEMESHKMHFKDTNPLEKDEKYIAHSGFNSLNDLENYISELQKEITTFITKWTGTDTQQGLNERLEELNAQIEAKYTNYRNGANRDADPEIEGLENEYLKLLELQEKELKRVNKITSKINELQEAKKRWINHNKERYSYPVKKRKEIQEQLIFAKKELKSLKAKQYMGDNSQFINDRISELENDIIPNLEIKEKDFNKDLGFEVKNRDVNNMVTWRPIVEETVTVKFNTNGIVNEPNLYKPITIKKGDRINRPINPKLVSSRKLDGEMEFANWTLNGQTFDFSEPINEDITLNADYKKIPIYPITYYDKGKILFIDTVKQGDILNNNRILDNKNFKVFDGWKLEDGTSFDFTKPITGPVELYASYNRDWKKIAAIGSGVALGGVTMAVDASLGLPGVVSLATATAMSGATLATTYKLKNHKTELIETENFKGIKKAGAKLVNYFRDNSNIERLNTFFKTALASTFIAGVSKNLYDKITPNNLIDTGIEDTTKNQSETVINDKKIDIDPSISESIPYVGGR